MEKEKTPDDQTNNFMVIEWSINKVFTVLQNHKRVQVNELVTCKVNDTKDIGKVIFSGTEAECNNILESYKSKKLARKKNHKLKKRRSKLNLPIFFNRPSLNSSALNLNFKNDENLLQTSAGKKFAPKYRSIENELNTFECDKDVAKFINKHRHRYSHHLEENNKSVENLSKSSYGNNDTTTTTTVDSVSDQLDNRSYRSSNGSLGVCKKCPCCHNWEKELIYLNDRLRYYESLLEMGPEIVKWFENLKLASRIQRDMDFSDQSILSLSSLYLNNETSSLNQPFSGTGSSVSVNRNSNQQSRTKVPEIVIENIV